MELKLVNNSLKKVIEKFCLENCSSISSVILFGSYAVGNAKIDSDVDIIIIDSACSEAYKKQTRIDGYLVQASVLNFHDALNILHGSREASHPFFPVSYDMAQILFDQHGLGKYLKELSTQLLKVGPIPLPGKKIETSRVSLINYLNDGSKSKYVGTSSAEALLWASQVINMCQDILLIQCNEWRLNNPRFKNKVMLEKYPRIREELHQALVSLSLKQKKAEFCLDIKRIMKDIINFNEESLEPHCAII